MTKFGISRHLDEDNRWFYKDDDVRSAAVAWQFVGFNLAEFDNYLEEGGWDTPLAKANRELLLLRRSEAVEAHAAYNSKLAFAWVSYLSLAMRVGKSLENLTPVARLGKKFRSGRKGGTVSPERGFVRTYLRKHPKSNPAKIFAALSVANRREIRAMETQSGQKFIYRPGLGKMDYRQFSNMVHTERKLQGLIAKK